MAPKVQKKLVFLGTGGTIGGVAPDAGDNLGYTSAQLGVADLVGALPMAGGLNMELVTEQVAQIDSKDMGFAVWQALAERCAAGLRDPAVMGIVVTHGTDTMEETAYFLHLFLSYSDLPVKPVVLTGAMRPASSLAPDGPQNLRDAITVAACPDASGVVVVFAGSLYGAVDVRKVHTYRTAAFDCGDVGALGFVEEGFVRMQHAWPGFTPAPLPAGFRLARDRSSETDWMSTLAALAPDRWPRVEIVLSHTGASGMMVDALCASGKRASDRVRGIVVAGTGNGSLHRDLEAALLRAQNEAIVVVRATRCIDGRVLSAPSCAMPDSGGLSPVKARIALILGLAGL